MSISIKRVLSAGILGLSVTAMAQQTVTCTSTKTRPRFCAANTRNGVVLLDERSDKVCDQGTTWSYTRRGITVKRGCSAVFQLGGATAADGTTSVGANARGGYNNRDNNQNNGQYNNQNSNNGNGYPNGRDRNDPGQNGAYNNNPNNNNGNANGNNGNGRNLNNANGYPNQNNTNGYPNQNPNNGNQNNQNPNYNNGNPNYNNQNGNNGYGNNGYGNNGTGRDAGVMVLPAGTRMDVRLEQNVTASTANQGDFVAATLVNDVTANGQVVLPAGTPVQAKIMSAQGAALDVRLDSVTARGMSFALVTNSMHSARDSQNAGSTGKQTAGQELGSILGAVVTGGQLPSGSVYTFRLASASRGVRVN